MKKPAINTTEQVEATETQAALDALPETKSVPMQNPAPSTSSPPKAIPPFVVNYVMDKQCAEAINARRRAAMAEVRAKTSDRNARPAIEGNEVHEGTIYPAIVVARWSALCVNLQVILDGNDSVWVTSVSEGEAPGNWFHP